MAARYIVYSNAINYTKKVISQSYLAATLLNQLMLIWHFKTNLIKVFHLIPRFAPNNVSLFTSSLTSIMLRNISCSLNILVAAKQRKKQESNFIVVLLLHRGFYGVFPPMLYFRCLVGALCYIEYAVETRTTELLFHLLIFSFMHFLRFWIILYISSASFRKLIQVVVLKPDESLFQRLNYSMKYSYFLSWFGWKVSSKEGKGFLR